LKKNAEINDFWRLYHQLSYFTGDGTPDAAAKLMFKKILRNFESEFEVKDAEQLAAEADPHA
jgi:hypothetical protein